jgi:hypothetical protein
MKATEDRLEYTTDGEPLLDFCLWEYPPAAAPAGKLRSVNLLFHSLEVAGVGEECFRLVDLLREGIGMAKTVFGVKWIGNRLGWEYYFYDYRRRQRTRSISRVVEAMRPLVACEVPVDEGLPYFMFSIDANPSVVSGGGPLDEIHLYVGNVGSAVSSGMCYSLTRRATVLENFYFFFDARTQMEEIRRKTGCSAYVDAAKVRLDQILWPELTSCRVIVVANKKENDAVYFAGIDIDQLFFFLKRMRYPAPLVSFVERHRPDLDHLRYDVGIDYRMEGGELVFLKSGYYGVF